MGRDLWGIVKGNQTFAGAGPSPTEDQGWMSTGAGAQLTHPSWLTMSQASLGGKLHTQVPPEGLQEEGRGSMGQIPTRATSCPFPPFSGAIAKELEMTFCMISFRQSARKV